MADSGTSLTARLDVERRDLLDLSLRNALLNFRPRARGLEIVGESSAQLFQALVRERRRLSFAAAPGVEASSPLGQPEDGSPILAPAADRTDFKLQTAHTSEQLQTRLLAIDHASRTSLEEQGVNTLFLALGMLVWFEDESSTRALRAPLILVPVALERSSARERFRLHWADEEELGVNLSLLEKLKADFQLALPDFPNDEEELDVSAYCDAVAAAVAERPRWSVARDESALGFFSFGKFLMYRDLQESAWPAGSQPSEHPIARALLQEGFRESQPAIGEDDHLDRVAAASTLPLVVDADASQTLALLDATQKRNLVIQGPPGTGKSQTITNLIAWAIGQGKTVLFVAEKMAALEVVKRRLDAVGLGDACLELHSHKTRKKAVLDELRRTLALGRPKREPDEDDRKLLAELRDRLNAYCDAVNTPVGLTGVTPHEAYGELLALRSALEDRTPPPLEIEGLGEWSAYDLKRRRVVVEQLQGMLAELGLPRDHPFWGARRASLLPTEGDRLRRLLLAARSETSALRDAAGRLAAYMGLPAPSRRDQCVLLLRGARHASKASRWTGVDVPSAEWQSRRADLDELFNAGASLAAVRTQYDNILLPEAWEQDLLETRHDLNAHGRHWWAFLFGSYRRARHRLAVFCRGELPRTLDEQLALVDAVLAARRHRETIHRHDTLGARLFGPRWHAERSDWPRLSALAEWVRTLHAHVRQQRLPDGILAFLASGPDVSALFPMARALRTALEAHREALRAVSEFLELDAPARFGTALGDLGLDELDDVLDFWLRRADVLRSLVAFNQFCGRCRDEGLGGLVPLAESWPDARQCLVAAFLRHFYEELLNQSFRQRSALADFDGRGHEHTIQTFGTLDRQVLRHNRAWVAQQHWERLPRHDGGGQLAVLRREFEKKARHRPLRQLMKDAGNAVRAIKPVFMMSPLSVATYLEPGVFEFDLVIFDEASQVRPIDALGALLRGKQAVVVGDSRQLPPTQFFDRLTGAENSDDEETTADLESVLGLFAAQGAPERMLRWHYRSRHESLIAVANREFYDDHLVVFPSPDSARSTRGLVLRHLPATVYDRGGTRTNPGEAEAVARAVMAFAREQLARPAEERSTLGVAAFSAAQMEAIQGRLELLRREDPSCEPFFAPGGPEPFFVKNLENVQGDERDVIFISIGYGRTAQGDLAMSFGPLNGDGGERRLNVLITRARLRCEVFSNLTADDIDLDRSPARGVHALKTFLAYAQHGHWQRAQATDTGGPSFEAAVCADLSASGAAVRRMGGSAALGLSLAVVDPADAGRYLLGIESDGAGYHSARSARDRDRLRAEVLEGLGWRLQRVWSTAWFRDPAAECQRILAALGSSAPRAAQNGHADLEPSSYEREEAEASLPAAVARPYTLATLDLHLNGQELHAIPVPRLAAWVERVVRTEGPVQRDEVTRRILEAAGVKRSGTRIQGALDAAVAQTVRQGTILQRGEFLWHADAPTPVLRDRSALPAALRRFDLVAPEELALAVERVIADALGMEAADIPAAACRLLGFARVSDEMRGRIEQVTAELTRSGRLNAQGDHLVIA